MWSLVGGRLTSSACLSEGVEADLDGGDRFSERLGNSKLENGLGGG